MGIKHSKSLEQFRKLDKKGRGYLTIDEILTAHDKGELKTEIPLSALILFHFNQSGDGHITIEEFSKLVKFARVHHKRKDKHTQKEHSHRRSQSHHGAIGNNYNVSGIFSDIEQSYNGVESLPVSEHDFVSEEISERSKPWLISHIDENDTLTILTDLLTHKDTRKKFAEWLFQTADKDNLHFISTSGLESVLVALEQDGIDPVTLTYTMDGRGEMADVVSNVLDEYDTHNTGKLTKDDFMTMADVILKEYETIFKRILLSSNQVGKYVFLRALGTGSDAVVRIAINKETGHRSAIKIVHKGCVADMSRLDIEIQSMKMLSHPNVVQLEEVFEDGENIFMVMELCAGGSIMNYIKKFEHDEPQTRKYFQELLDGVIYCHSRGVAHRDLRIENILLNQLGVLKITDFGHAGIFKQGWDYFSTMLVGSIYHTSPEQVNNRCYSGEAIDVWSLGIILYQLIVGEPPFFEKEAQVLLEKIKNGDFEMLDCMSEDLKDLLSNLLEKDPEKRYTLEQIKNHRWMEGEVKEPIRWKHYIRISGSLFENFGSTLSENIIRALKREGEDLQFHQVKGNINDIHVIDIERDLKFGIVIKKEKSSAEIVFELLEGESWTFMKVCRKLKRDLEEIFKTQSDDAVDVLDEAHIDEDVDVKEGDFSCGSLNTPATAYLDKVYGGRTPTTLDVNLDKQKRTLDTHLHFTDSELNTPNSVVETVSESDGEDIENVSNSSTSFAAGISDTDDESSDEGPFVFQ